MSDADALLAFMCEREVDADTGDAVGPYVRRNGDQFARNLNVAAAEIGWTPVRLSEAMQALVADGRVEAAHEDADPTRIAASSWRIVADDPSGAPVTLDEMTVAQLRDYADAHDIDLEDATKKADVRAAIDLAEGR